MYKIVKAEDPNSIIGDTSNVNPMKLLKSKWDELHDQSDVFKYKIVDLKERIVDDKYFIQLNPDRGTKRRMPQQIDNIHQPFDESKFNFTKISTKEILFHLKTDESKLHSIVSNTSPISRYNSLLCPSLSECLPQIITEGSLVIALYFMFLALDRDLRIVFNSLCGMASVNHLHYHLLVEPKSLPVEKAKCVHLKGPVYYFQDYVVPAFCFQIQTIEAVRASSKEIFKVLAYLLNKSIAHNLIITRGENLATEDNNSVVRVIIYPRKNSTGAKDFNVPFNIATLELSGMILVYDKNVFEKLTSEDIEHVLKKSKIDNFHNLCEDVKSMF